MPSIKTTTAIHEDVTLTADAGADSTVSAPAVNLTLGYGAELHVKLTNGATGPTLPAEVQIEVSADNSEWYAFGGAMVGQVGNDDVTTWSIDIPIGVKYLRLSSGSNTDEDVTIDADISQVTKL